jgi:RND family efflux transporter MFP subunit
MSAFPGRHASTAAAALLWLAIGQGAPAQPAVAATASQQPPLAVVAAVYRDVDRIITAEALVEPVRQSTLAAQVAGRVVEFAVKAGDRVKAGQVIARIDARAAEQAVVASQAQVAEARAQLVNARGNYERTRQLVAQKFMSQAALDQAEAQYKAAQAQVAALEAGAGQAATQRSFTTISAPYAGVVAATHAEVGDMAQPGRELVTLFEPGKLRVTATLPQGALAKVRAEAPVRIEIPALGRTETATQVTPLPVADVSTHTTKIRLDLPAVDGLLPGQFARAQFVVGRARKLVVPEQAVLRRSEVTAVYVVAGGRALLRQVRLGEVVGERLVEVLAGLREGERVALDPIRAGSAAAGNLPAGVHPGESS